MLRRSVISLIWIFLSHNGLQFSDGKCDTYNNGVSYTTYYHYRSIGLFYNSPTSIIKRSVMDKARFDMRLAAKQCITNCQRETQQNCIAVNFNTENATCELLTTQPTFQLDPLIVHDDSWVMYTQKKLEMAKDCADLPHYTGVLTIKTTDDKIMNVYCDNGLQGRTKDCTDLPHYTGVLTIKTTENRIMNVYCDNGWLYLSRRYDGSVDFFRTYVEYQSGFGDPDGEYFLGLVNLVSVLNQGEYTMRVDLKMWPPENTEGYAEYSTFHVAGAYDGYRLTISGYSGNAGDSLSGHRFMKFTTKDKDQDLNVANCAEMFKGGWWYTSCHATNLFGIYSQGPVCQLYATCMTWSAWPDIIGSPNNQHYSFKETAMKLFRKS